jgi:CBS domain-containing protein
MDAPTRRRIRTRRINRPADDPIVDRTVPCPRHLGGAPLATCISCSRCAEVDSASVACRPSVPEPDAPPMRKSWPQAALATPVSEAMSVDVECAAAELPLGQVRRILRARNIGGVPVVDGDGAPLGILSERELIDRRERPRRCTAADLMTPVAYVLRETDPLARAAALMALDGTHRLVVVGGDGRVIGILTALDLARWIARAAGYLS